MKVFETKVSGVKFENLDGSDRQHILKNCTVKEKLLLIKEPNIQFPDAVKVCRISGEQLGYLNDDTCHEIAPLLDSGYSIEAMITELTGGGFFSGKERNRECSIKITIFEKSPN
jgi:hypothetical protein